MTTGSCSPASTTPLREGSVTPLESTLVQRSPSYNKRKRKIEREQFRRRSRSHACACERVLWCITTTSHRGRQSSVARDAGVQDEMLVQQRLPAVPGSSPLRCSCSSSSPAPLWGGTHRPPRAGAGAESWGLTSLLCLGVSGEQRKTVRIKQQNKELTSREFRNCAQARREVRCSIERSELSYKRHTRETRGSENQWLRLEAVVRGSGNRPLAPDSDLREP